MSKVAAAKKLKRTEAVGAGTWPPLYLSWLVEAAPGETTVVFMSARDRYVLSALQINDAGDVVSIERAEMDGEVFYSKDVVLKPRKWKFGTTATVTLQNRSDKPKEVTVHAISRREGDPWLKGKADWRVALQSSRGI